MMWCTDVLLATEDYVVDIFWYTVYGLWLLVAVRGVTDSRTTAAAAAAVGITSTDNDDDDDDTTVNIIPVTMIPAPRKSTCVFLRFLVIHMRRKLLTN